MSESKMPDRVYLGYGPFIARDGSSILSVSIEKMGYHQTEYIRADLVPKWIPVSERLPEDERYYDVALYAKGIEDGIVRIGYYHKRFNVWKDQDGWIDNDGYTITHWRERPEYPTEGI